MKDWLIENDTIGNMIRQFNPAIPARDIPPLEAEMRERMLGGFDDLVQDLKMAADLDGQKRFYYRLHTTAAELVQDLSKMEQMQAYAEANALEPTQESRDAQALKYASKLAGSVIKWAINAAKELEWIPAYREEIISKNLTRDLANMLRDKGPKR